MTQQEIAQKLKGKGSMIHTRMYHISIHIMCVGEVSSYYQILLMFCDSR